MTRRIAKRNGKPKIRLLHVLTTLDVGGAEKKVLSVASRLPRDRYEIAVAWLKGRGELAPAFRAAGIETCPLGMEGLFDFRVFRRALRLVRRMRPHVVHTHLMKADATGAFAARFASVPVLVSTKHNEDQYLRFPPFAIGARVAAEMADRVVVISTAVGRFFRSRILLPEERMLRIPYGFPPHGLGPAAGAAAREDLRRELTLPKDAKVVTCVGRLTRQKGLFDLLRAASLTREAVPEARFLLVGRGELLPALRAHAARLHLDSRVRFLGFRRDVPRILAGSHLLALPSHWEGFGVVLVEAMSAGLPVVGTRAGAIPEVVADGETGLLAPPGDAQDLATALVRVLADPDLADRMGQAGRRRVAREFAIDREVKAHVELYEGLLREKLGR